MIPDLSLLRSRARVFRCIRGYFLAAGYLEVDTPLLSPFLIPEAHLEVFATVLRPPHAPARPLYLIPSPELWMKRLLCAGTGSIFQITKSFRNHEPESPLHQAEFSLLEWYTVDANYLDSIAVLEQLTAALLTELALPSRLPWQQTELDVSVPFARLSMHEAFRQILNIDLEALSERKAIAGAARALGLPLGHTDSWADIFHKIFLTRVEPELPRRRALIVYDYPAAITTTAKRKAGTMWAERWELYLGGVEIANCYSEETNPARLADFIAREEAGKRQALVPHPKDAELVSWLETGCPDCSGVALGVDRLLLFLLNRADLEGVNLFPLSAIMRAKIASGKEHHDKSGSNRQGNLPSDQGRSLRGG
jgi:lysyl-tRNA synthetase class 2